MISLGQTALYGVAGFTLGNLALADGGSKIAWNPWVATVVGIAVATALGLLFGAIASRSEGIYFLMITLALAILVFYFFGQSTELSGFGGLNQILPPDLIGNPRRDPERLYYAALILCVAVYFALRYLVRTPFGITMQGIRDDPTRMRALGYNVALHRTLIFGVGAFVAALGGVLSVWYNQQISPGSIDVGRTIDVLVIAVIGGLLRLEGAWLGAIVFVVLDDQLRGETTRFNTYIGVVFLAIVLLSPGGLLGISSSVAGHLRRFLRDKGPGVDDPPRPAMGEPGT